MADATRDEAIQWCIDNKVDFTNPKFPPPEGWMWADTGVPAKALAAIFTNTEDEDIESVDVLFKVAAEHAAERTDYMERTPAKHREE